MCTVIGLLFILFMQLGS
uniref:Uncharacterized protein n=1 Tax=Anguilla anguilla TaxID=7936 RepID=A0A0E9Q2X4_ANGAN